MKKRKALENDLLFALITRLRKADAAKSQFIRSTNKN